MLRSVVSNISLILQLIQDVPCIITQSGLVIRLPNGDMLDHPLQPSKCTHIYVWRYW